MNKNLYEVLGVEKNASTEEIKKAYKKLAQIYHPDMHATASEEEKLMYEEKFKELNNAHEILSNPTKKAEYDYDLAYEKAKNTSTYQNSSYNNEGYSSYSTKRNRSQEYDDTYNDFDDEPFSMVNELKEIFSETKEKYKQAWYEIKEEESKYPFSERHREYSKYIHKKYYPTSDKIIAKVGYGAMSGILHVGKEFLYQLAKLNHYKEDSIPKFVVRNRNVITTAVIAAMLLTGSAIDTLGQEIWSDDYSTSQTTEDENTATITLYRKYTLQYGDTLSELAAAANTTASEIASDNGIKNKSLIQEGDEIKIPYHYREEDLDYATEVISCDEDDRIGKIAAEANTTIATIKSLNEDAFDEYGVPLTSEILVPNFISYQDLAALKASGNSQKSQ